MAYNKALYKFICLLTLLLIDVCLDKEVRVNLEVIRVLSPDPNPNSG